MSHLRTFVILEPGITSEVVRQTLNLDSSFSEPLYADMDQSSAIVESPSDLLLVACSVYSEDLRSLIERAAAADTLRPIVVLCWGNLHEYFSNLFAAGATDIVNLPQEQAQLGSVLEKTLARRGSGISSAPLVAVIGAKGGVGKTICSCNLAASLAKAGKRVAIVDGDLQFGDVAVTLGIRHVTHTIADLYKSGGTIDREKLADYLVQDSHGINALLAPLRPEEAGWLSEDLLYRVFTLLRQTHDYVIVDTCPGFPSEVVMAIEASSRVFMVGSLDIASLKDSHIGLKTLDSLGYDRNNVCVVLNKADQSLGITIPEAVTVLGAKPDVIIPFDRQVIRSYNSGEPIVLQSGRRASDAAKAFRHLSEWLEQSRERDTQQQPEQVFSPQSLSSALAGVTR